MFARSRRGFLVGGVAALVGIFSWKWMGDETKAALFRRTFAFNESVSKFFYSTRRLAAEFPPERITRPERFNGAEGLAEEITAADWRLQVKGLPGSTADLTLTIDDVKRLPRTEMITEFKCIEGWSTIVHWAGVRFSDFIAAYSPTITPRDLPKYVLLLTPDEKYFVGWDIESILHPQTLLAYEMNEAPLRHEHGAPLRLASTAKYGIKQIKRVGTIEFTNERPRDFWSQPVFGYDWYSGH
ncbi:MAG: molybdopterin-dependent oxidoreductase [Acidobacteria bacterium]|nr:molybdopterin-dependent oxidoreductase [Acidobacteriota bacterium]